jgi:dienelactone hydrolase
MGMGFPLAMLGNGNAGGLPMFRAPQHGARPAPSGRISRDCGRPSRHDDFLDRIVTRVRRSFHRSWPRRWQRRQGMPGHYRRAARDARIIGLALLLGLGLRAAAAAPAVEAAAFMGLQATLTVPETPQPWPAVVVLHDALGPDGRSEAYAVQLAAAGIAVLDLLTEGDDADRLAEAAALLERDPRIAAGRLGLLGFGAGGAAALAAPARFGARAALYPGCGTLPAEGYLPGPGEAVLLLHGDADPANRPADCEAVARDLAQPGASIRRIAYRGATYAWDRPQHGLQARSLLPWPGRAARVPSRAWPELAAMSAAQVAGFFALNLR